MIQKAFVDTSMGITQIKEWYRLFKNGRRSVDSDPRSGRPSLTSKRFDDIETIRSNATRSRTALRCGSTTGTVWFNQMGTTSKDATVRMTKNSTNAEI